MDVDFKRLLGSKSFDELCAELFQRLLEAGFPATNLNPGGVYRTYGEAIMQSVAELYQLLEQVAPKGLGIYAQDTWLDIWAAGLGITRQEAGKAEGTVVFSRQAPGGAVVIPANTIVKTPTDDTGLEYRYITAEEAILPAGVLSVSVPVIAESIGAAYNVGPGTISRIVTHVPGIDAISNASGWLTKEGRDVESNESLLLRCVLRWNELSAGTELYYLSVARKAAGVAEVYVVDELRGKGTLDIVIWGSAGVPTSELLDNVRAQFTRSRRILTVDLLVRAPFLVPVDVQETLYLAPSASDADLAAAQAEAVRRVNVYFGYGPPDPVNVPERLYIGRDVDLAMLYSLSRRINKVQGVAVLSPPAEVPVLPGRRAVLNSCEIAAVRAADE
ncbi:MAG: baseplate J/gp47 family protein [Bacteroidota bacterium]